MSLGLIRGAGGVAALAHPSYDLQELTLRTLIAAGQGAIEVAGPRHRRLAEAPWRDRADRLGLVSIAGSDFQAAERPGRWLGLDHHPGAGPGAAPTDQILMVERLVSEGRRPPTPED